ncbi:MAG: hypothetical protein LUG61_09615 [Lachnospiraceae bacterium]|nr:hypothetical protein [Lachnospiraceae bacterium]
MKHRKIRPLCGLALASAMVLATAGCAQTTTDTAESQTQSEAAENTFVYADDSEEAPVSTTLTGTVESIDGNEVTLSIRMGDRNDFGQGDGQPGGNDDMGQGGEEMNREAPSDIPEGEAGSGTDGGKQLSDKPDGEAGDGIDGGGQPGDMPDSDAENGTDSGEQPGDIPDGDTREGAEGGEQPSDIPDTDAAGRSASAEQPDSNMTGGSQAILTIGDESVIAVETEEGDTQTGSLEDITEGSMLQITFDEEGTITEILVSSGMGGDMAMGGDMQNGMGMGGDMAMGGGGMSGSSSGVDSYSAVNAYTTDTDVTNKVISSTGTDENAVLVSDGASVSFQNVTVDRTSTDSTGGDNSSFYGVGAAMLVTDGTLIVSDSTITTDAAGGAGVFAYGDGTAYVLDTTILTTQDTSGGVHAAGGGIMVIDGGTYTSNGEGSPALYCTADIAVNDAVLTATGSEAICMEGLNTIHLFNCDITGNMSDLSQNDTTWTVIVYQSMSGDSEVGTSTMQIIGGTLTSENGGIFYTTNTESEIYISGVDITASDDCEFFLMCTGNANERGWGTTGANGSICSFTAADQEMEGDVIWGSISTLDFYIMDGSTLTGAVSDDETYAGNGGDGSCSIYLSEDSTWIVTRDSTVTNLYAEGAITDTNGNSVTITGTDGTVYVNGTSSYTITVDAYSTTADFSCASEADSWANHAVAKPEI